MIFYFSKTTLNNYCNLWPQQIEILLGKTENFDELMAAAAEERGDTGDTDEQS